jgi:hypothetical protein
LETVRSQCGISTWRAGDLSALMLLLMATGDRKGLEGLAAKAGKCFDFSQWHDVMIRKYDRGEGSE